MDVVESALHEAQQLEEEGRTREAVDVLMEANRRHPDPEIERVLVLTRHAALDELEPGPGVDTWPRELPDPFPDAIGPPEVELAELTGDVLGGAIVNHGCLMVRGLATKEEADSTQPFHRSGLRRVRRPQQRHSTRGDGAVVRPVQPAPRLPAHASVSVGGCATVVVCGRPTHLD